MAEGLQCFARLPTDRLILISTSAIKHILQLTHKLVANYKVSSGQDQPPHRISRDALEGLEVSRPSKQDPTILDGLHANPLTNDEPPVHLNDISEAEGN